MTIRIGIITEYLELIWFRLINTLSEWTEIEHIFAFIFSLCF